MQKARRSSIQSTKTYKAFQAFQPQDLTQAFQFYKDIPDIPVIHDIPALQTFLHVPAPFNTPVPSSAIQCIQCFQGFHPFQHFFNQNAILHTDWFPPETPLSTSRIQDITLTFILQRKGDVAISVKMTFRINSPFRVI